MAEVLIVTERFAVGCLVFDAEVRAAGFVPVKGIAREQLREFQEICHSACPLKLLVQPCSSPANE